MRLIPVCLLAILLFSSSIRSAVAGEKAWTEVRSPNFRVLTDGSANQGRRIAREFEQMRAVFAAGFPNMRLDTGAPLLILAPHDEDAMKAMAPAKWKGRGPKPGGYFQNGWERQYAVVRLDQDIPGSYNVVYHEYVHSLLHVNFRWLPTWLDEGLAEFYGSTRFEDSKIYVGAPNGRVARIRNVTLIPVEELISENPWRKYRNDEERIDTFYGEAWALVHYMMFGPNMDNGKKLNKFYSELLQGADQKKAFQEIFGNFSDLEKGLQEYTTRFVFNSYAMPNPPQIHEKDFAARLMSVAETSAEIGTYRLWSHDRDEARALIETVLREDPKSALAHEDVGFLDFADGRDDEARTEFVKAYEADPQSYLSLFYKIMLSGRPSGPAPADQLAFRTAMYDVLKINSRFAPAFIELALANTRAGNLRAAVPLALKAENLEPSRAGYYLLTARLLLETGHPEEAAKQASFVAARWKGPDRDEAIALWNRIPADKRPEDASLTEDPIPDVKTAEGTLVSVTCDKGTSLVLQNADGKVNYRNGGSFLVGYSDTLWYGADHFNLCHHIEGMHAIVRYKPSQNKEIAGEWTELELRDDLPTPPATMNGAAPSPAASN